MFDRVENKFTLQRGHSLWIREWMYACYNNCVPMHLPVWICFRRDILTARYLLNRCCFPSFNSFASFQVCLDTLSLQTDSLRVLGWRWRGYPVEVGHLNEENGALWHSGRSRGEGRVTVKRLREASHVLIPTLDSHCHRSPPKSIPLCTTEALQPTM